MPFIVEFTLNFNSCIIFLGTNTSVKFVAKIARLFRGQIDPLIIFGRDILNFIAGLAQWRGLAQTLVLTTEDHVMRKHVNISKSFH